jgi:hypothetical protein
MPLIAAGACGLLYSTPDDILRWHLLGELGPR